MIKKNIAKKITAVAVGVVLSAMSCMPVFADYVHEVGWSDEQCSNCKDATVWIREIYKDAIPTGNQQICYDHGHKYGVDLEMCQIIVTEYECRECGLHWEITDSVYYWECHGFDNPNNN